MDTLKKELWELLRIFDHICREEHIDYWVDYGTLLGAVRHQGFIPWDDDIDVSMRYEDYLRFLRYATSISPPTSERSTTTAVKTASPPSAAISKTPPSYWKMCWATPS